MQTTVLSRQDAATYLSNQGYSIKKSTLQKLASLGGGPRYRIFGNRAIYSVDDLNEWLKTKIGPYRSSTSVVVTAEPEVFKHRAPSKNVCLIADAQHPTSQNPAP